MFSSETMINANSLIMKILRTVSRNKNRAEEFESPSTHRYQSPQPCFLTYTIASESVQNEAGPPKISEAECCDTQMQSFKKVEKIESENIC